MAGRKAIDMTGERFGRLLVIGRAPKSGWDARWSCRCECGRDVVVRRFNLLSGQISCGCHLQSETYHANLRAGQAKRRRS
jgi:hypothetical protein